MKKWHPEWNVVCMHVFPCKQLLQGDGVLVESKVRFLQKLRTTT